MDNLIERLKERIKDPDKYISMAKQTQKAEQILGKDKFGYTSKIPQPATYQQIQLAENELGFQIPKLLQEIYTQVANGGFGPGYGLLGLPPNGATDDQGENAVSLQLAIEDPDEPDVYVWPDKLLPICYYGCNIYACLDCATEEGTIVFYEDDLEILPNMPTLKEWLEEWLNNPYSREKL